MTGSKVNEWLQILASLGVLAGLLLVAYEIRESNRYATSEAVRGIEDCFNELSKLELETNIVDLFVKSFEEPDLLSAAEKLKLSRYLSTVMGCYQRWSNMYQLGVARWDGMDELRDSVDFYFSSAFGRAWFAESRHEFYPEMGEVVEAELATLPVRTEPPDIASSISDQ